jgi:hypothetical protein
MKKMKSKAIKYLILSSIFILTFGEVVAQKKCKYSFDKEDPMTNERVRRNYVKGKSYFKFAFYRKANDFRFETLIVFNGTQEFVVPKGQEIVVKLGNGDVIKGINADNATPNSYVANAAVMTNYSMSYIVSKEQMELMAKHGITVVSTKLGNKTYTLEFKEKALEKNKVKIACMLVD